MRYKHYLTFRPRTILISLLLFLGSCVGTIEDKNIDVSKTAEAKKEQITFSGIIEARAIAHDKVEVFFNPAAGDQTELTYEIYVNNSLNPIKVQGTALQTNTKGEYVYTVTGLYVDTNYAFKIGVVDTEGNFAKDKFSKFARTFSNQTCDFTGISGVSLPSGEDSLSKVKIEWVPGTKLGTGPIDVKPTDPTAYEIFYVSDQSGPSAIFNTSAPDQTVVTGVSKDAREYTVGGLDPGKSYYFVVRCVHAAYETNKSDPGYKKEENTKMLKIQTATGGEVFDFNTASVKLTTPDGKTGETAIDVAWEAATGSFNAYRIYVHDATMDNPVSPLSVPDKLNDDNPDSVDAKVGTAEEFIISASATSYRLTGLRKYHYYQVKVVACRASCAKNDRIVPASPKVHFVKPTIAPFQGVTSIDNPRDSTTTDTIYLKFNAPSMTAGYAHRMDLYCISNKNDPDNNKWLFDTDSSPAQITGSSSSCDGLAVDDPKPFPTTESSLGTFTEVAIKGVDIITPTEYCFLMVPVLDFSEATPSNSFYESDVPNSITKCVTPEIRTPNMVEFPGRTLNNCTVSGNSISTEWPAPTSGIFDNFIVFWKEKNGTPFNYNEAIAARGNAITDQLTGCSPYCWKQGLSKTTNTYNIENLDPGRSYNLGVLTYIDLDPTAAISYKYSENNLNTGACTVELPKAKFALWEQIYSIGPKENGMMPPTSSTIGAEFRHFPETMLADGIPEEVAFNPDSNTDNLIFDEGPVDSSLDGAGKIFDGIFGYLQGDKDTYPNAYLFSNTGIIQLKFQDVTMDINGANRTMREVIDLFYPGGNTAHDALAKKDRTFGYKIYRSDDNKATWKELTTKDHPFQTTTNDGLILPTRIQNSDPSYPRPRANETPTGADLWIANFTDYSVQFFSDDNNGISRPRVYWYKVTPVFDNRELIFDDKYVDPDVDNPIHNLVKVVLPPANMALVHRMMANKTICDELSRGVYKGLNKHYSCDYNGLGASSVTRPWNTENTVYDLGGDLLVDRFELGCNFTRGNVDSNSALSTFSNPVEDFAGDTDSSGQVFRGCFNPNGNTETTDMPADSADYGNVYSEMITGDCIGDDKKRMPYNYCAVLPPNGVTSRDWRFPGAGGMDNTDCTVLNQTAHGENRQKDGFDYSRNVAQSEFGAVYYTRGNSGWYNIPQPWLRAPAGKELVQYASVNRCMINLPVKDSTNTGKWVPRWIGTNQLFKDGSTTWLKNQNYEDNTAITNISLEMIKSTVNDILGSSQFYDQTPGADVDKPDPSYIGLDRFDPALTPLARIFSSNAAKLPPLDGFGQVDLHNICSTYKVQQSATSPTGDIVAIDDVKEKRTWRRKEQIVSSAWPTHYDHAKIISLENGSYNEAAVVKACNVSGNVINGGTLMNGDKYPSTLTSNVNNTFITTGTGALDTGPSTERCISKFGIQDHVGNKLEWTGDRVFCDFGQDVMVFGSAGTPDLGSTHIPYRDTGCITRNEADGSCNETGNDAQWFFEINTGFVVQVQEFPGSGQCSVVQPTGNRIGVAYLNGSTMNSVFSPTSVFPSGINENIVLGIAQSHFDVGGMDFLRNGDGFFLDFGDVNIAPRIARNNSLQLRTPGGTDERLARFFNPVIGFPLDCSPGTCTDSPDNMLAANSDLYNLWGSGGYSDVVEPVYQNWPLGNSDIINTGISAVSNQETITYDSDSTPVENFRTYITAIDATKNQISATGEMFYTPYVFGSPGTNNKTVSKFIQDNEPHTYQRWDWTIPRNTRLFFKVGGAYNTNNAGRYYLQLQGDAESWLRRTDYRQGGRCAVLLNDE